jgi:predicted phage-related endonuclease
MKTHNLIQGSPEWQQFRLGMYGASEASAMLGLSKKVNRTELLHMKHTGTPKEFSDWVQKNILDYGHEVEALARPIVEEIIRDDLYPVTCSQEHGFLSASVDGLTMDESTAFEHKQWNEQLAASVREKILPDEYMPQCQQVMMVTGAQRVVFVVSDGTKEKMVWMEVFPDPVWFERIVAGWNQFEMDFATYVPIIHSEKPQPNAIMQLPALAVQIRGEVLTSNLPAFTSAAERFLANIKTDLQTDADFADAEETVKFCDRAEKELELAKKAAIEQTVDIAELMRTIDYVKDELRSKRLMLDKLVKTQKETIKSQILADARLKFAEHLAAIETEIKPIRLVYQQPDFAGAIKNKRTLASLHDAVDSTLANAKIATDAIAKDVRTKLAWHKEHAAGYEMLFADLDRIIYKPTDDFQMLVKNRIDQHKLDEKKKIEAEVLRVQEENKKKAAEEAAKAAVVQAAPAPLAVTEAPKPTLVKTDPKQVIADRIQPTMIMLARRDLEFIRTKYSGIPELVMVMEEIDSFLTETAEPEAASA